MSWTFTTSGSAILSGGQYANATIIISGSALASWSDEAEGYIAAHTRRDWKTNYASLDADIKLALTCAANAYIGNKIINYDMSGFTSRLEAENMLDVNFDVLTSQVQILSDFKSGKLLVM